MSSTKSWVSKGADFDKLKAILLNNKKVADMAPKMIHEEFGFTDYELNSFRNGLNKLKKDLGIESRKGKSPADGTDAESALNNYLMSNDGKCTVYSQYLI